MGNIDFNKPDRTDPALDIIENIRISFRELGKLLGDSNITNPFDGLVRLNPTARRLEKYDAGSGTWVQFLDKGDAALAYDMRTAFANHADTATDADSAMTAAACTGDCDGTASNATNLGNKPSTDYRLKSETLGITEGGTGATTAENARTYLDLLRKASNGSDIPDKATFRANIGLAAGTTARTNLGLGSSAIYNIGAGDTNVPLIQYIKPNYSFTEQGYLQERLTGFMVQWGRVWISRHIVIDVPYPTAFPHAALAVLCSAGEFYSATDTDVQARLSDRFKCQMYGCAFDQYAHFLAIGW